MPAMPHAKASTSGRRAIENYVDLGRTSIQSHFRMALDNTPPGTPGSALPIRNNNRFHGMRPSSLPFHSTA